MNSRATVRVLGLTCSSHGPSSALSGCKPGPLHLSLDLFSWENGKRKGGHIFQNSFLVKMDKERERREALKSLKSP